MFVLLVAAASFVGWSAPPIALERTGAVRIACVGDSITAGYLASNASFAYPGRLQALLDAKHGAGAFEVFNFGAGGATVQKGADSPYWQRDQYKQFISSTYDAVIVMLGTNDAKHQNWPMNCSLPDASAETCTVVQDYLALLDVAKTKGVGGKQPKLAVMTPPPLWKDGAYAMNQSVLNDVMPLVVPKIAAAAALPAPIDVYSALGGAPDWRTTYPAGCTPMNTSQPAACALFCATGESCDACHPDDDGYLVLAQTVFDWLESSRTLASPAPSAPALLDALAAVNNSDATAAEALCAGALANATKADALAAFHAAGAPAALPHGCYFLCVIGAGLVPSILEKVPWDGKCFRTPPTATRNGSMINAFGKPGKACTPQLDFLTADFFNGESWSDPSGGGAVVIQYNGAVNWMRDELRDAGGAAGYAALHDTWLGKFYISRDEVTDFALLPVAC